VVLITHEMSVIRALCGEMAVMDAGQIVERGAVEALFNNPQSPAAKEMLNV
jgi:D-methionine transport system ATP-binding protein